MPLLGANDQIWTHSDCKVHVHVLNDSAEYGTECSKGYICWNQTCTNQFRFDFLILN